jgi:cell division protein FtsB
MTEAHLELVKTALFSRDAAGRLLTAPMAAQLIAGCEAAAVQTAMLREYGNLSATNESLAKERDQLRAEIARLDAEKPWLKEANATNADLRAEVKRLTSVVLRMKDTIDKTEETLGGLKQGEGYWDMVRRVVDTASCAKKAEVEL